MTNVVTASGRFGGPGGRKLAIAVGDTVTRRQVTNKSITWEALVAQLRAVIRTKESHREYMNASRERQDRIKDVGYYVPGHFEGGIRRKSRIQFRCCFVADLDFAKNPFREAFEKAFGRWSYVLHSTHKHEPSHPRLRLVMPFLRPLTEDEYLAVARKLAETLDIEWFDDTSFEFSRVMHWPSCSRDAKYVFVENQGEWVDPDEILAWYDNWHDVQQWPTSSRQAGKLRRAADKAEDPRSKSGLVGAFCRTYTIPEAIDAFLPETYTPAHDGSNRYTYVPGTTSNGAVVYDDGLFLFSHHGTDPCSGRLVNAWDLVRLHRFGERDVKAREDCSPGQLPSFQAMADWVQNLETVHAEHVRSVIAAGLDELDTLDDLDGATENRDPSEAATAPPGEEIEDDLGLGPGGDDDLDVDELLGGSRATTDRYAWTAKLQTTKQGHLQATLQNLTAILNHDPVLKGSVALNEFSLDVVQCRSLPGWPLRDTTNGDLWTDHCDVLFKHHLERIYSLQAGRSLISEAIDLVAHEHRWHPVRDYFRSLQWDGEPRVDRLFIDYLGTPDDRYHRHVARKFMTAAVTRIFRPGAKFDHCVVLEGPQGQRKSTFIETLARGWFTDDFKTFDSSQKAVEVMSGKLIVEVPDLHGFTAAQIEAIKAFFTRTTERVRLAYKHRAMDYPRQTVFIASTNDPEYLKDLTGNRRFWPVQVINRFIPLARLKTNLNQLWAEAVTFYDAGEPLYLNEGIEQVAREEQEARTIQDDLAGMVREWLQTPVPKGYLNEIEGGEEFDEGPKILRDRVCAIQVWREVLGGTADRYTLRDAARINRVLRTIPELKRSKGVIRFGRRYGTQRGFWIHSPIDDMGLD